MVLFSIKFFVSALGTPEGYQKDKPRQLCPLFITEQTDLRQQQ